MSKKQRAQDQHTSHRGRSGLGQMAFRAVSADRLAVALAAPQKVDQRASEDKTEDQSGEERGSGAECDILKEVEEPPSSENAVSQ